jgi:hypothetical protein
MQSREGHSAPLFTKGDQVPSNSERRVDDQNLEQWSGSFVHATSRVLELPVAISCAAFDGIPATQRDAARTFLESLNLAVRLWAAFCRRWNAVSADDQHAVLQRIDRVELTNVLFLGEQATLDELSHSSRHLCGADLSAVADLRGPLLGWNAKDILSLNLVEFPAHLRKHSPPADVQSLIGSVGSNDSSINSHLTEMDQSLGAFHEDIPRLLEIFWGPHEGIEDVRDALADMGELSQHCLGHCDVGLAAYRAIMNE